MSEQAKPVGASDKMKAKDFITLGILRCYSLLW
jgi:energy-coupling factor transport system substrate-specific component